ncbi:hypothetical protein MPSEU_000605700 [Mayamaea pseudoterrestris]|nr:hypothetical protein MPSEU_000605700 [Mayamaea pseudoterrestris]
MLSKYSFLGGLSAAGAQIRNAGDSIAQAAASCRFKTGSELVTDELREAATCLDEACSKLKAAVQEAKEDDMDLLANVIELSIDPVQSTSTALEAAGACIMQKDPLATVGANLAVGGKNLTLLSTVIKKIDSANANAELSSQRMVFAADQMILAGNELQGIQPMKPKGKGWLKG